MAESKRRHVEISYEEEVPKKQSKEATTATTGDLPFEQVALLPIPTDNCAITTKRVDVGTRIVWQGEEPFTIRHTVLEGEELVSWGMPFGRATKDIATGDYVCNSSILTTLSERQGLSLTLPNDHNFEDCTAPVSMDYFKTAPELPLSEENLTFQGFRRPESRGIGVRNFIVLLGLTSRVASFARVLENKVKSSINLQKYPNISGIVSVSHTEGGTQEPINNRELLLRTLSGFIGAVIVLDIPPATSEGVIGIKMLQEYMEGKQFPLSDVLCDFYDLSGDFSVDVEQCLGLVRSRLDEVNSFTREACPASALSIALQCGGSDAFSGISANPLSGLVGRENGGSAVLAETDELIGAEQWILKCSKDEQVATNFLKMVDRYKQWAAWHGHSADGNPSGGNKLRGLYNISLKSLGAAMKKPEDVRLEGVLEYGERLRFKRGYYFMDSPGNDLESIAGQVAVGCQIIFFTTGNGSITNFPFVPTVKIVTTTQRFKLLEHDMDFDAGQYLSGVPMSTLVKGLFNRTLEVANGQLTVGEKAGHSQVSIWRNWAQTDDSLITEMRKQGLPTVTSCIHEGVEVPLSTEIDADPEYLSLAQATNKVNKTKIGLILPTSICSSHIAKLIAEQLNQLEEKGEARKLRYVSLPHTEGCGSSSGIGEIIYSRTMLNHLISPVVHKAVLLEHGCEKTHNDYMRKEMQGLGIPETNFGYASVQLDGGIESVSKKVMAMFEAPVEPLEVSVGLGDLKIGILEPACAKLTDFAARSLAKVALAIVEAGGYVVIPFGCHTLTANPVFLGLILDHTVGVTKLGPTLSFGQRPKEMKGLHFMEVFSDNWVEAISGLGGTGIESLVTLCEEQEVLKLVPGHPMLPLLRVASSVASPLPPETLTSNFDVVLPQDPPQWPRTILEALLGVERGELEPKLQEVVDFQIPRGHFGISL